jgi:hypothetical protein
MNLLFIIACVWASGGVVSMITMKIIHVVSKRKKRAFCPYKWREYISGFTYSWLTVAVILFILLLNYFHRKYFDGIQNTSGNRTH